MRAILQTRYGGPDDLILTDLPLPEPARGEVRVRVRACGVNLSDWEGLTGSPFYARLSGGVTRLRPRVLGSDIIGEVTALGPGVEGPVLGTRVLADVVMAPCGFAEYACLPVKALARVPDDLSDDVAASLPQPGPIAMAGTRGLGPGDRLLINGAGGGAGQLAVALAKATGAHVTAVDRGAKLPWLRDRGADETIDYETEDFATGGQRWTHILDLVASRGPAAIARCLAPGGRYRAVGGRTRTLLALAAGGLPYRLVGKSIGVLAVPTGPEALSAAAILATEGALSPQVETVGLDDAPEALRRVGAGEVRGKLVIRP